MLEPVGGMHSVIIPIHAAPTASAVRLLLNSVPLVLEVGRDLWLELVECAYLEPTRVIIRLLLLVECTMSTVLLIGANIRRRDFLPSLTVPRIRLARLVSPACKLLLVNPRVHRSDVLPRNMLVHVVIVLPGATIRLALPLAFRLSLAPETLKSGTPMFENSCVIFYNPQPRCVELRWNISRCPDRRLLAAEATENIECGYLSLAETMVRVRLAGTAAPWLRPFAIRVIRSLSA